MTGVGRPDAMMDLDPAGTPLTVDQRSELPVAMSESAPPRRSARRRGRWRRRLALGALCALMAGGLGYLVGNEVQATAQFDQARHALQIRTGHIRVVLAQLAAVETHLQHVNGQASSDAATLSGDAAQLQSLQGQVSATQADVARQTSDIVDLQTCLGGVEEALNALAEADRSVALNALEAVTDSCQRAVAADG